MDIDQAQRTLLLRIKENTRACARFGVLCAEFEAALDEVEDPEKTDPFGNLAIQPDPADVTGGLTESAEVVAVAWLEMLARAIMDQGGRVCPILFDEDGLAVLSDTSELFRVAKGRGFNFAHARRAFSRVRGGAPIVPQRALKILGAVGAISVPKRKQGLRLTSRVKLLDEHFARSLNSNEVARAKAGSLYYSLIVADGLYKAGRARKVPVRKDRQRRADDLLVISEFDLDVISDFSSPFVPCGEAQPFAIDHFVAHLAEKGYTYQRLVYRAPTA